MAIVKDYMDGPCHVIIDDQYAALNPEEIQKILDRLGRIYTGIFEQKNFQQRLEHEILNQKKSKSNRRS